MSNERQLPAFTLLEIILVMIIGAIVITLIFQGLQNVNATWSSFSKRQNKITATLLLRKTLEKDIEDSRMVISTGKQTLLLVAKFDTIEYTFGQDFVNRYRAQNDTFFVKTENLQPAYLNSMPETNIVSKISFDIIDPFRLTDISITKHYTSGDLMPFFYQ